MKKSVPFFFIFNIAISFAQTSSTTLLIPKSNSPNIDGTIGNNEWKSAVTFTIGGVSQLYLMHDGGYLYIGIKGIFEPWGHLYLRSRSEVSIYHCTSALGKVLYKQERSGLWNTSRKYNWKMKNDEVTRDGLQRFGNEDSWVASKEFASDNRELEFKISLKNFDVNSFYFAIVCGLKEKKFIKWPNSLNDGTLKIEYLTGHNPINLKFNFDQWGNLNFSN